VLGSPVTFGGEQARPGGIGDTPAQQEDVGFLARLQQTELGVDGG
jgi:hypothetical protein